MPANKNAMTRYKILDDLLSDQYHDYSLDDLTEEVSNRLSEIDPKTNGVVRRTIEKDIKYLEEDGPFLVEIKRYYVDCYSKEKQKTFSKKCLKYANPVYSIFKKEMSSEEKYLLKETLSILGQFEGLPHLATLEALRKSIGIIHKDQRIISLTKNPLENSNLIGELFTAISQKQVVELQYHKFSAPTDIQSIILYPYLLKEYNRRWYLISAAEAGSKLLNFSLDRIDKVIPLPSHQYVEYDGDINEFFDDIIGITNYDDQTPNSILFWVSDISKDYVASKPIHDSQKLYKGDADVYYRKQYPMLTNGCFFSIECKFNYELIRELTSFGEHLVVLYPNQIVEKIQERLERMKIIYEKSRI